MEKTVVCKFLYPTLLSHPSTLSFSDQFALRPTVSPCVAIISLLNTITNMLLSNSLVTVISLDFNKAFGEDGPAGSASQCLQLVDFQCPVFPMLRCSRSSASLSAMACRRPIMFVASSLTARKLSCVEFCAPTAWVIQPCRSSSGRSSLPNYSMRAVLGGASPIRPTGCESTPSCGSVFVAATVRLICLHSTSWARLPNQQLFSNILTNSGHLLHTFIHPPTVASQNYNLRIHPHNRQLTLHSGYLTDC